MWFTSSPFSILSAEQRLASDKYLMTTIPLGLESENSDASFYPPVQLINLYIQPDTSGASVDEALRLQRPGLTSFATVSSTVRGMFQSDGVQGSATFVAAGALLQTVNGSGVASTIGNIFNDQKTVGFAAAFDKLAISSAGRLYLLNNGTLTQVAIPDADTDPQNRLALDITAVNNYIVMACPDGRFYWLPPGVSDWTTGTNALNFATAESAADGLVACHALADELYLFGSSSTEVWQTTGSADLPFQRAPGRNFSRGCLHADTVQLLDNTLFFVGDNAVVYRSGAVPTRVSTFAIEEHLTKRSGNPSALVLTIDAHEFYVLKIPGRGSFAYDASNKKWCQFRSYNQTEWRPQYAVRVGAKTLLGDALSPAVYTFDRSATTDAGQPIERIVSGTIPLPSRRSTRNDSISLFVGSSAPCSYRIRWHDGQQDFPTSYISLSARAGADVLNLYRLGHGTESYRTFEISIIDPAIIRISGMTANEAFD